MIASVIWLAFGENPEPGGQAVDEGNKQPVGSRTGQLRAAGPQAQKALDLVRQYAVTSAIADRIAGDPYKNVTIFVFPDDPPNDIGPDGLAHTETGPETRAEYNSNRSLPGTPNPVEVPIFIYLQRFKPGTLGYDLGLDNWIAVRVAHELWHADTLYGTEPNIQDMGTVTGEMFYHWLKLNAP